MGQYQDFNFDTISRRCWPSIVRSMQCRYLTS